MAFADWFSVPAMFILMREVIEAAIIVGVMLQFCDKTGNRTAKKQVWIGAIIGLVLSFIAGIVFITLYYTLKTEVFSGKGEQIFEATMALFACIMITVMAFGMLNISKFQAKIEAKIAKSGSITLKKNQRYGMAILAFITVIREGIESVVFIAGVGTENAVQGLVIGGVVGILIGCVVGWVITRGLKAATIKWFFYISAVCLFIIAAGMCRIAFHEMQEAGAFGVYEAEPGQTVSWLNTVVWDWCDCCGNDQHVFALAKSLFGYTCDPTRIELIAYFGYWFFVILGLLATFFLRKRTPEELLSPPSEVSDDMENGQVEKMDNDLVKSASANNDLSYDKKVVDDSSPVEVDERSAPASEYPSSDSTAVVTPAVAAAV